jgi:UDP-N-acetylglucosamine--N-acetylmuramyl-(pentapeptide) pyrophosphoryl-undecaprenol N-acetylglucosamine transferase
VIGVGGYASGPAMLAAILKHTPTLAFEPNLVPGFANRMVARFVSAAAVHFEQTADHFRNAVVTGVPVRPAFFQIPKKAYSPGSPTLLVFGGSQGARAINQAVIRSLPELMRRLPGLHVIHQTGEREYNEVQAAYSGISISAEVYKFIDDMPAFFARADFPAPPTIISVATRRRWSRPMRRSFLKRRGWMKSGWWTPSKRCSRIQRGWAE